MVWLWAGLALASDTTLLGWVHVEQGRSTAAMEGARTALRADPHDLGAHRLHTWAGSRVAGGGATLRSTYAGWVEREPDHPGARLGHASLLAVFRPEGWCDEVVAQIGEPSAVPALGYQQLRVLEAAARECAELDGEAVTAQLLALADAPGAEGSVVGWAAWYRLKHDGVGEGAAATVRAAVATDPGRIPSLARLVWDAKGKHARAAREEVISAAEGLAEADDIGRRWLAQMALEIAGDPRAEAMREALDAEDPRQQSSAWTERMREIYDADQKPTHALGLAALDALDVPPEDPAYGFWLDRRKARLEAMDDADGLYAVEAALAALRPEDGDAVNDWAWDAAERGEDLEAALVAIDRVLGADPPVWTLSDGPHAAWAEALRGDRAFWLDTRGWLLHRLGREEAARDCLRDALRHSDDAELHGHLSVVLMALDDPEAAYGHAAAALVQGEPGAEVRSIAESLWVSHGPWHPDGLAGWIADRRAEVEVESADASAPARAAHPLVGERFPLEQVDALKGGSLALTGHDGPLVVDVWATWCGPCVSGMPHLQEVAAEYADRGVRVVGLSVDQKRAPAVAFFRGAGEMAYDLAWIGQPGWEALQLSGIPALFVVDPDGTVRSMISGYGGADDTRLEAALEGALGG